MTEKEKAKLLTDIQALARKVDLASDFARRLTYNDSAVSEKAQEVADELSAIFIKLIGLKDKL